MFLIRMLRRRPYSKACAEEYGEGPEAESSKCEIQAGATVKHNPTGEEWFVIGVNKAQNKICVAGWPSTIADLSNCTLIKAGGELTDKELNYRNKEFGYGWD
jgi:hypothetical protein